MPTPLGHTLAGVAVATLVTGRLVPVDRRGWGIIALAVLAASVPDLDFIHLGANGWPTVSGIYHHGFTHSLGFALALPLVALLWGRREAALVGGGLVSHVLLDLLVTDTYAANGIGIPLFWPVSDRYFIVPIIHAFDRSDPWQGANIVAIMVEMGVGLSLVGMALFACRRSGQVAVNRTEEGG